MHNDLYVQRQFNKIQKKNGLKPFDYNLKSKLCKVSLLFSKMKMICLISHLID